MIDEIKDLRVGIDGLTQRTQEIGMRNREISCSITAFETSKMWLGRALKEAGTVNPYPESKDPSSKKIEPTADTATITPWSDDYPDHISRIKYLRKWADELETQLEVISDAAASQNAPTKMMLAFTFAYQHLAEGLMWLGMELGRLYKLENNG
jgi:hypothetical protein